MKKPLSILTILTFATNIFAQEPDVQWKKNFGGSDSDYYQSVTAVSDGIVAVGFSASGSFDNGDWAGVTGNGGADAIIVKYDNDGNVIWKKNFGGNGNDYYQSVTAVSDGIVAVGYSQATSFDNGDWAGTIAKGDNDAIIIKYDNDGNVIWKKNFGGSGIDQYNSIIAVSDGIVAVGYSNPGSFGNGDWTGVTGKGSADAIIVKYDNDGNVVWKKNFGGSGQDDYQSITAISDGVVVMGRSYPDSFGNGDWAGITGNGGIDAIIVKYDNAGNVIWKNNFGGSSSDYYNSVTAVSDGIVVAGYSEEYSFNSGDWTGVTGNGNRDATIVKYDNDGNVVWRKNFGGILVDMYSYVTTVSDGVVAVGMSHVLSFGTGDWTGITGNGGVRDAIIVKYDNAGNVVWKKNFGGVGLDDYYGVTTVPGGVVAVGISTGSFNTGDWTDVVGKGGLDAIIVKYSLNETETEISSVSNLEANFTNCHIEVNFDFTSNTPTDLTLMYSADGGITWLPCTTVSGDITGQTTGHKTIIWDCNADNVFWGLFEFKVDFPQQPEQPDICGCKVKSTLTEPPYNGWITFMCYNLGANPNMSIAEQMAYTPSPNTTNSIDATVYGDLYQWGRPTDGHEKRTSGTTTTLATTNIPGHGDFIISSYSPYDWRSPRNDSLWGDGTQNVSTPKAANDPCPAGWRMPTQKEWQSIMNGNTSIVFDIPASGYAGTSGNTWVWNSVGTRGWKIIPSGETEPTLFLPAAGYRSYYDGTRNDAGTYGYYWSATVNGADSYGVGFSSSDVSMSSNGGSRAFAFPCRCVKE